MFCMYWTSSGVAGPISLSRGTGIDGSGDRVAIRHVVTLQNVVDVVTL